MRPSLATQFVSQAVASRFTRSTRRLNLSRSLVRNSIMAAGPTAASTADAAPPIVQYVVLRRDLGKAHPHLDSRR
jgi:hypothetical protein